MKSSVNGVGGQKNGKVKDQMLHNPEEIDHPLPEDTSVSDACPAVQNQHISC